MVFFCWALLPKKTRVEKILCERVNLFPIGFSTNLALFSGLLEPPFPKIAFPCGAASTSAHPEGQTACLPLTKGLGCHDWRRIWNTIPNIRRVYKAALRFVHSPWTKVAWIWMLTDSIRQDLKTNCYRAVSYDLKKCQSSFMWTICGKVSEGRPVIAWCHGREGSAFFLPSSSPSQEIGESVGTQNTKESETIRLWTQLNVFLQGRPFITEIG